MISKSFLLIIQDNNWIYYSNILISFELEIYTIYFIFDYWFELFWDSCQLTTW